MKIKNSVILPLIIIILVANVIAGSYTFKQNEPIDFKFTCLDEDNNYCNALSKLAISITAPNGTTLISNLSMTWNLNNYNVSLPTVENGVYKALVVGLNENASSEFTYMVNPLGKEFTNSQAILYFLIFFIALIVFAICLTAGMYLPYSNKKDEMTGYIFAVENMKYFKMLLLAFSYLVFILLMYFGYIISYGYLDLDFVGNIFYFIFYAMVVILFPAFGIGIFIVISNFVKDQKIGEMIQRGIPVK